MTLGGVNQFELIFSKMLEYDPMDTRWYKMSDFEWLGNTVKFFMIMLKFGEPHSWLIFKANS